MTFLVDVHTHVTPDAFPDAPGIGSRDRWPSMHCGSASCATMFVGDKPFREIDDRSWSATRRMEDMERQGVGVQVLSPMPELLSYWLPVEDCEKLCDHVNGQIAAMVTVYPGHFCGLGMVPMQDPQQAAAMARRLRPSFGLAGVEIGSNINGMMLGDPCFDPFYAAAEECGLAIFVHALHPVAAKAIGADPVYTAFAGFPIDVTMTIASLLLNGTMERFPRLRMGFSHGGGSIAAILGRLDKGWMATQGFGRPDSVRPSEQALNLFYDSNVYDTSFLSHIARDTLKDRVFLGTDYPYLIMQEDPAEYLASTSLGAAERARIGFGAARDFLGADLHIGRHGAALVSHSQGE